VAGTFSTRGSILVPIALDSLRENRFSSEWVFAN